MSHYAGLLVSAVLACSALELFSLARSRSGTHQKEAEQELSESSSSSIRRSCVFLYNARRKHPNHTYARLESRCVRADRSNALTSTPRSRPLALPVNPLHLLTSSPHPLARSAAAIAVLFQTFIAMFSAALSAAGAKAPTAARGIASSAARMSGRKFFVGGNWKCNGSVAKVMLGHAGSYLVMLGRVKDTCSGRESGLP